mmetsp:Transcript_6015/g.16865  ORF Transcript_6015/g.16865 Transcript_6015/m.16865 type:complete len:389 (-) Transcript_6015:136-1302(-)
MMAKRKTKCVIALLATVAPSAVHVVEGNAFFANGRRSTWTLNLQLSSTLEGIGGEYRKGRPNIHSHRPTRRSANTELARRTIEELRGGGGGRSGRYDDSGYHGDYNGDDGDGGGYYGDYNGGGDDGDGEGYYGNSQQGSPSHNRDPDDYYGRGKGSYYDDEDRYRGDNYGYGRYNDGAQPPSSHSRKGRSRSLSGSSGGSGASEDAGGPASFLPKVIRGGNKKYGLYCLIGGSCLTGLGMVLFFNKALIRLGNLLFVSGIPLFIGPTKTIKFFMNPEKFRATGCVLMGLFLVFVGWPISGILLELFGLLNLFGNMFPIVKLLLRNTPGLGSLLTKNGSKGSSKSKRRRNDDYDDDYYRDSDRHQGGQDDLGDDGHGYGGGGGGNGGYY